MLLTADELVIDQGATWSDSWLYEEGPTEDALAPVDLSSGWVGRCQVRRRYDGQILASWHSVEPADGPIVLTSGGLVILTLAAATSVPWTWWKYSDVASRPVFDIELEHVASQRVVRITEGTALLRAEVTES